MSCVRNFLLLQLILLCLQAFPSLCFHTTSNVEYDCWPLNASRDNSEVIDCGGLGLEWIIEPPNEIDKGEISFVAYRPIPSEAFYTGKPGFSNFNTSEQLHQFCDNTSCPEDARDANVDNCCVWHANIHTCHPSVTAEGELCGPWVGNNGQLSTHTAALAGTILTNFSANFRINFVGANIMIAHLRVGNMQIAIGKEILVRLPRVCGDDICSKDIGENCNTCPTDCCPFTFPPGATAGIVIFCVLIPGVIILVAAGYWYYRRHKFFIDESWIIAYDKIQRDTDYRGFMGSLVSVKNVKFLNPEAETGSESTLHSIKKRQLFTQTGIYEGRTVAIKTTPRNDIVLNNTIRREVMMVRILDHPNLCRFIGATLKDPTNSAIISEYCPKGSLNDVLLNDDIPLNWGFRFSFATDIARGMAYLHSKKIYHGRLTSSNCIIDDRWVVKISDYGLPSFRVPEKPTDYSASNRSALLKIYMPPEVRGLSDAPPTPTMDTYSYAIILLEVALRMDPYSEDLILDSSFKPKVSLSNLSEHDCPCPQEYLDLIHRCWAFLPAFRPTFEQTKKSLYRMNPIKESPVDNMMILMEKYSKHLEVLVADRTQELIAEQKKTATLLYSMLPKSVADDLKQGKPASAECFKSATIFFSDIIGFTSLASTSTPIQIITMLNELYSTFDDILDQFDVYKVETIGDAYMVVSGVPKVNGYKHAGEIASMALQLVSACEKFQIPHRPNTKLEIRVGIHSGPVCSGVVGLKMPRYCLFGDTVNTASRMETTSEAMKIQCSDACYNLLKKLGGYQLECRGNISVKGKGSMITWWLVGKNEIRKHFSSVSLGQNRTTVTSPPPGKGRGLSRRAISEIIKDGQTDGLKTKKLSQESSVDSSLMEQTVTLPGSIL